ncbi:MAG: HAMP domain-containing protein [Nitrospirota bacterium]|nr:MAG: HAMP domain-containing protein [Nitrospirota bacterium]
MKNKRFIILVSLLFVLLLVALNIEYYYLQIETDVTTKFLIIFLFNFSIISLLTLIFFVSKNLFRLWMEKRRRIIGYKFKTKLVATFVILTLVPSLMLFLIASEIVSNYIDRWFDPQIERPLKDSVELSRTFYEIERERTINKARKVIRGEIFRDNITVRILEEMPEDASETIKNAFEGKEGTEVITREDADVIRAVIPELKGKEVIRVFVAEGLVPPGIVEKIENIKFAQGNYTAMKKLKLPLKLNYLLVLAFFTSLIVFMAMWVALKISKGITEPIGTLANATEDIATGNLDVTIDMERDDEIGMLVSSFNNMVSELKDSKESLVRAYLEADRRRVAIESIVENVEAGVISTDNNGRVRTINDSACRILGIDRAELEKERWNYEKLLSKIESEDLKEFIKTIDLTDTRTIRDQVTIHINGKKLILKLFITRLMLPDDRPVGLLVVFDDLTDIIRAEQALTWQDIARRIAHEIKNPLTPIKLSAERIMKKWEKKDDDLGHTIDSATRTIIREVNGLRKLVDEFTKFGRMPEITKLDADLVSIMKEAVELYSEYEDVNISVDMNNGIPNISLDPEQIRRVLINLLDNAINAIDGRGEIIVSGEYLPKEERIRLEIADSGKGIEEEDMDKLFLPYFSTSKDGTGLGLAISHMIISKHGGTISVANRSPHGAVFSIELPV